MTKKSKTTPAAVLNQAIEDGKFKRAVGRTMGIVRDIESSGILADKGATELYVQFRAAMRVLLCSADLRPFYQQAGRWGNASTRDWIATNMLLAGARMAPINPKATAAASEIAIVVLELLTRFDLSNAEKAEPAKAANDG